MKRKKISAKVWASIMAAAMVMSTCPTAAFAVTADKVAADGTYTATRHVYRTIEDTDDEWNEYDVDVTVSVKDGKISDITATPKNGYVEADNSSYFSKAYSKKNGIRTLLTGKDATEDTINGWSTVSGATRTSKAIKEAALEAIQSAPEASAAQEAYVLMNIPYADFYAAEGDADVDAVSSATKMKTRASLAAGSYHVNSDGTDISGITFPVKVSDLAALTGKYTQITDESKVDITTSIKGKESTTTYSGKDALFESGNYSYYVLSEAPSYYKELTVNEDGSFSFGTVKGTEATTLTDVTGSFSTSSKYGDYQLNLDGLPDTINTVYGVTISTKEGDSYGLRHVENIWKKTKLAWSTGFVTEAHGSKLSYADYVSMMGQTINKVTYYTDAGVYEIPMNQYVPVKFANTIAVENASADAGKTTVTITGLPKDYDAQYTVEGLKNAEVKNGILTFDKDSAAPGQYTLRVTDKNAKYAELSASFELTTDKAVVAYDNVSDSLVAVEGASADEVTSYIKNIKTVTVNGKAYNASGKGSVKIVNEDGTLNEEAAPFKDAKAGDEFEISVKATGYANDFSFTYVAPEYTYVYASVPYAEYYANEDVQNAGSAASSDVMDTNGEYDKGAFDTVTRATANHGLHRGSFQCVAVIEAENGKTYEVSHWSSDGKEITLTNGNVIKFNRGEITDTDGTITKLKDYEVTGLKYVPVKVASADYEAFCQKYNVVENGGELVGGYGENKLAAYSVKANVTEATNGLKTVTKDEKGNFSFSARQAGSDSGIEGQTLKTAPDATEAGLTVKDAKGSYGEFLRVDLTGNYGDLGANMQATYGTKFAADNWMHKTKGIQLALTKSLRCTLPEGTDGTGYWTITIAALGYKDVTYQFQATDANIVKDSEEEISTDELKKAIEAAEALTESDYTADSWAAMQAELQEAKDELKDPKTQATVDEATHHLNAAIEALVKAQKETYVLMNIPYDQFYKADVNNDVKVDAFTSATKNKVRTGSLAGGSYHVDASGDEITGVTFPVKVPAGTDLSKYTQITDDSKVSITVTNRGQESTTDYTGKDALFESASYSYYTLSEKPSYYKELTVNEDGTFSFGATQGTATTITEGVTAELMTESKYGDYQLDLDGLTDTIPSGTAIYGVIVSTKEGSDYGMRHLENIWRVSELAWATGFTTAVHNCPTSSEHYKAMMGQHIDKVTYYTANGIYEIPVGGEKGLYVPVKFDTSAVAVADAELKDGETSVATTISGLTLPEGFDAEYTVEGATASVKGEKLILKDVKKGAYTLTITDKSGKYAPISFRFEVYAETMPAAYNENSEKPGLAKAAGATDAEFADYIKNITSVSVNGKPYAVSGRNAVKLFNDDGTLITDAAPFAEGDSFEIVVTATGYKDLSFVYKKAAKEDPAKEINIASLEKAIQSAEALKEADYTADSWKVLQVALKNAKSALEAKKDQTSVDNAAASLNKAIEALVKADGTTPTPTPTTTPTATPAASKNNITTSGTGNKTTTSSGSTSTSKTAKTGDPTNILEMLGLAVASLGTGGFALKRRKRNKK